MHSLQPPEFEIKERKTTRITGTLTQEDEVTPVPGSTLTACTLTIYANDIDQTLIVDHRNILNANNCVIAESGAFVLLLAPADVPIQNSALPFERHIGLIEWTWGVSPVKSGAQEFVLIVRNLAKVG